MTTLLDSNVLISLAVEDHDQHDAAAEWFGAGEGAFATCPITQGALVRHVVRHGSSAHSAQDFLAALGRLERHEFWSDDLPWTDVAVSGIVGHRQVTDAYLAQLARRHDGRLATFDRGLVAAHPDVADLLPAR